MVRNYKRKPGTKVYQNYEQITFQTALRQYRRGQISLREAQQIYEIPKSTLQRHNTGPMKKHGGQTILTQNEEEHLVQLIVLAGEWGYPFDKWDIRCAVKGYLDRKGVKISRFKKNLPGPDWVRSFLFRHKNVLTQRLCENIKRARAGVTHESVNLYFDNLQDTLKDIQPNSIVNYDETCFVDDPGRKKVVVRRKTRHPERIIDFSKSSTSVMFAASGEGHFLPPFVVYKSEHLYDTWMANGPRNARYGRNSSGWFDQPLFENWFQSVAFPYLMKQPAPRVLIGDNLCSHLSYKVIELCEENSIKFVFLPPSSTHLTQPLDVAVFGPLKKSWRRVLQDWKNKYKGPIPKQYFPALLKKALDEMKTLQENIKKGFSGTGIIPLDRNQVLKRLPKLNNDENVPLNWTASVVDLLNSGRNACKPTVTKKKKVSVAPGQSVSLEDFTAPGSSNRQAADPSNNQEAGSSNNQAADKDFYSLDEFEELDAYEESNPSSSDESQPDEPLNFGIGDFVEIEYSTEKGNKYFIGLVQEIEDELVTIKFLRPNRKKLSCFVFPAVDDISQINRNQVTRLFPKPTNLRRGGYEFAKKPSNRAYSNV